MPPVFLDTSGLIAVANADDQWHEAAQRVWSRLFASGVPLVTTSLIWIEIGDGLSRIHQRQLAINLRQRLIASPRIDVVRISETLESRAWELYGSRHDKEWGLTDCASMIVAQDFGVRETFTVDHHFGQAGFNVLIVP